MKFTDTFIKNLKADTFIKNLKAEKEWVEKIEATGLGVRVTPNGNKSWFYRFTFNGKRCKKSLGKYPASSIKQAREHLLNAQTLKEKGINPIEHSKQEKLKHKNTVKALILSWYTNYIEKHRKQPKQAKQQIDADIIPLFGDMELDKIHPRDITNALDKIVNRGSPIQAAPLSMLIKF